MATITLLSLTARIEGEADPLSYGGTDLLEAMALLESLDSDVVESLQLNLSGFDQDTQARMLNRMARWDDMTVEVLPPEHAHLALPAGQMCEALRQDGLSWLSEMSG